jgi:hypothetical protein
MTSQSVGANLYTVASAIECRISNGPKVVDAKMPELHAASKSLVQTQGACVKLLQPHNGHRAAILGQRGEKVQTLCGSTLMSIMS